MSSKAVIVGIDSLKETFFVRQKLNEDHVITLAEMYEAGVDLPPLLVTRDHEVVDGRHRKSALEMLNRRSVSVVYAEETDRSQLIMRAVRANMGGALPPTRNDITYAIRQMLECGMSRAELQKQFQQSFPPSLVRRYLQTVFANVNRDKVNRAVSSVVNDGLTVPQAAEKFDVKPEAVREIISGNKKKKSGMSEVKGTLTNIYRSRGAKAAAIIGRLLRAYEDGEVSAAKVEEIFKYLDTMLKSNQKSIRDWQARFNALKRQKVA